MGFLGQTYDANELPEGQGYDLIPAGWYDAEIKKADVKPTKDGTGTRLNIQFKITDSPDGKYIGRVVFAGLNIALPNSPEAERIGKEQFGALLRACNLPPIDDSDELVGQHLRIKVKVKPAQGEYEANNEAAGFRSLDDSSSAESSRPKPSAGPGSRKPPSAAAKPSGRQAAEAPGATSGKKPLPWAKKR